MGCVLGVLGGTRWRDGFGEWIVIRFGQWEGVAGRTLVLVCQTTFGVVEVTPFHVRARATGLACMGPIVISRSAGQGFSILHQSASGPPAPRTLDAEVPLTIFNISGRRSGEPACSVVLRAHERLARPSKVRPCERQVDGRAGRRACVGEGMSASILFHSFATTRWAADLCSVMKASATRLAQRSTHRRRAHSGRESADCAEAALVMWTSKSLVHRR